MRRGKLHIGRWLCNAATAAALLFAAAAVALWARSRWADDSLYVSRGSVAATVMTPRNGCLFQWTGGAGWERDRPLSIRRFSNPPDDMIRGNWLFWTQSQPRRLLGVITWGRRASDGGRGWGMSILVPYWLLACAAVAAAPGLFMISRRLRRKARHRAGQCVRCGYDLRGMPQGGRCPECGAVPQPRISEPIQRTATTSRGAVE